MDQKIRQISIHAFRGIPDLDLKLDGKNLLLLGENGTGKSSIVDALEFFFTGTIKHLEKAQTISLARHAPHVNFDSDELNVTVSLDPGNVSLSRTFRDPPIVPHEFSDYFEVSQKRKTILRRAEILAFIESQPAQRSREIGEIIGIGELDDVELTFMRLRDDLEGEKNAMEGQLKSYFDQASIELGASVRDKAELLEILNKSLEGLGTTPIEDLSKIAEHSKRIFDSMQDKISLIQKSRALVELIVILKGVQLGSVRDKQIGRLQNLAVQFINNGQVSRIPLLDLLKKGKESLPYVDKDQCPLCQQYIKSEDLFERIEARLMTLQKLSDEASLIRVESSHVATQLEEASFAVDQAVPRIDAFPDLSDLKANIQSLSKFLADFANKTRTLADQNDVASVKLVDYASAADGRTNQIIEWLEKANSEINVPKSDLKVLESIQLIDRISQLMSRYDRDSSKLSKLTREFEIAQKLFETFSEVKKEKIQQIYSNIESDIKRFYAHLHPGEKIGDIELTMSSERRASTLLKMQSFGREGEDPRGLQSEGHLDSMGLCIFLSFVRKFNEGSSLMVLDDVVSSIDARHRQEICSLLFEEFKDKQVVITTHDEMWFGQLRQAERVYGIEGKFVNKRIVDWDIERGPTITQSKIDWEDIQEKLASGDKNSAGNAGRIYLEWILQETCQNLKVSIEYQGTNPHYDVGDLLIPAKIRIKELIREGSYKTEVDTALKKLEMTIILGNLLSHANLLNNVTSMDEVRKFCEAVNGLRTVLSCSSCGSFLGYDRERSELRCAGRNCSARDTVKTR